MLSKSSSNGLFIVIAIFNLPLFEQASHQHRKYVYVETKMTWNLAQRYCRRYHTDLATFRNEKEFDAPGTPIQNNKNYWIGLQRDKNNRDVWKWSDGEEANFTNWHSTEPDGYAKREDCAVMVSLFWRDYPCEHIFTFLCYDDLILVKENKTWEEALEHCRNLEIDSTSNNTDSNQGFDLPHMDFGVRNLVGEEAIMDSQTPEVWIGLRFMAGEWLWLNGMLLSEPLPACPAPDMYCGTMSKTGKLLPMGNCLERRNFLCSKRG